jgi:hypothetical protein
MRKLIYCIACFILVASCANNQKAKQIVQRAELMNKSNIPLDTLKGMDEAVDYYQSHGSADERMTANYLMGCVYRDKGDAPAALKYYHTAIGMADTTDKNCNYKLLSRIYGQIAFVSNEQRSPRLELDATAQAVKYSLMAKDTLSAIIFYEKSAGAYYLLSDYDSAMIVSRKAYHQYITKGRKDLAAGSLPMMIDICIKHRDFHRAKKAIDEFERYSELFITDKKGNVRMGGEQYYYLKGLYYEGVNNLDSALFYYRKLSAYHDDINNIEASYKGLTSVYLKRHQTDSIAKYARLYANANDSANTLNSSTEINRMQSVYNYNEKQRIADIKTEEARRYKTAIVLIAFIFLLAALLIYQYIRRKNSKRLEDERIMNIKYANAMSRYNDAIEEIRIHNQDYKQYRISKQEEIDNLQKMLALFQEDKAKPDQWNIEQALLSSHIVKQLHTLACTAKVASYEELKDLHETVSKSIPAFYGRISDKQFNLSIQEINVSVLIRLRFIPSEIAVLLNLTKQRISNIRSSANTKLFNKGGARTFDCHIRQL